MPLPSLDGSWQKSCARWKTNRCVCGYFFLDFLSTLSVILRANTTTPRFSGCVCVCVPGAKENTRCTRFAWSLGRECFLIMVWIFLPLPAFIQRIAKTSYHATLPSHLRPSIGHRLRWLLFLSVRFLCTKSLPNSNFRLELNCKTNSEIGEAHFRHDKTFPLVIDCYCRGEKPS